MPIVLTVMSMWSVCKLSFMTVYHILIIVSFADTYETVQTQPSVFFLGHGIVLLCNVAEEFYSFCPPHCARWGQNTSHTS